MRMHIRNLVPALLLAASALAFAQAPPENVPRRLGEVLDQGARPLSGKEFGDDVVQRTLEGPTPSGGNQVLMYVSNGTISGNGSIPGVMMLMSVPFRGSWTIDERDRVCTKLDFTGVTYHSVAAGEARCQYWYKLGDRYYLSDSDSDRSARVVWRKVAQ